MSRSRLLLTRRQLLASLSAAGAAGLAGPWPARAEPPPPPAPPSPWTWEPGWGGERAQPLAGDLASAGGLDDADPLA